MSKTKDNQEETTVGLRSARLTDVTWMTDMRCDPQLVGNHNWSGEPVDRDAIADELRAGIESDGLVNHGSGTLIVELGGVTPIGDVSWRTERWGPSSRSRCPAIGIALLPNFRGRGFGTEAQRLLVDHLFMADESLHRVQSDTAVDNPAEQRALTKMGMTEEGRVRHAEFRNGQFHDHILFSILRSEWETQRRHGSTGRTSGSS